MGIQVAQATTTPKAPVAVSPLLAPAPDIFEAKGRAVWDGKRTLQGVWVAHPLAASARRVRIYNEKNGQAVDGALFKRDAALGGAPVLISSEAAELLGLIVGETTALRIVAVKPIETPIQPPVDLQAEAGDQSEEPLSNEATVETDEGDAKPTAETAEDDSAKEEVASTEGTSENDQGSDGPKTVEAPQSTETLETTEETRTVEVPATTEEPKTAEAPETAAAPKTAEAPSTPEAPETTEAPATTETQVPTEDQPEPQVATGPTPDAKPEETESDTAAQPEKPLANDARSVGDATSANEQVAAEQAAPPKEDVVATADTPEKDPPIRTDRVFKFEEPPKEEPAEKPQQQAKAPDPKKPSPLRRPFVQAGVFGVSSNATKLVSTLKRKGIPAKGIKLKSGLTRVVAGPFQTTADRNRAQNELRRLGMKDAVPVRR